jgi:hypothetical protein
VIIYLAKRHAVHENGVIGGSGSTAVLRPVIH